MKKQVVMIFAFFFVGVFGQGDGFAQLWPGHDGIVLENNQRTSIVITKLQFEYGKKKFSKSLHIRLTPKKILFQKLPVGVKGKTHVRCVVVFQQGKKTNKRSFSFTASKKVVVLKL